MSLVGSLEDLGLGEILQIISLSGKSGILQVRGEGGEVRVVFADGMIRAAFPKDGPTDLRELLLGQELMPAEVLEDAVAQVRGRSVALGDWLVAHSLVSAEVLDGVRRAHVERCVLPLFAWDTGEFSFDVREVFHGPGKDLFVTPGVSPQMLALEGTRIRDEARRDAAQTPQPDEDPLQADGDSPLTDPGWPGDDDEPPPDRPILGEAEQPEPAAEAREVAPRTTHAQATSAAAVPAVVAIDPSLAVLDWIKGAVGDLFHRVHVFQRTDLGVGRIRQYLARAEVPIVVLAWDAPPDPLSGVQGPADLIARLRAQSARIPVVVLVRAGSRWEGPPGARPSALAERPTASQLVDPRCAGLRDRLATDLRSALVRCQRSLPGPGEGPLREALPVLLRRAAEVFSRVAAFEVSDGVAVGLAQCGLPRAGGPDDSGLRDVRLAAAQPAWFRAALEGGAPVRAGPSNGGDEELAFLIGNLLAREAWVAPVHLAGRVAALLYADNLPGGEPLGDTAALEQLVREVGRVLDSA
jgi:hypothetical protein